MKRLILCALLFTSSTSAEIFDDWTVNGYGSLRAGFLDTDGDNIDLLKFYDENTEVQWDTESLVGVQVNAPLTDNLSFVTQLVAKGADNWDLETKWAYLKYDIDQNYTVKVGRMAMPLFHHSQTEFIGYLHDFGRLPKSVYIGHEFNVIEGIGFDTKHFVGNGMFLRTQWNYGEWDGDLFQSVTNEFFPASFKRILSFNVELSGDAWKVFGGKLVADNRAEFLDQGIDDLAVPVLDSLGIPLEAARPLLDALYVTDKKVDYQYFGFQFDNDDWNFNGEVSYYGIKDSIDSYNFAWYLSAGKTVGLHTVTFHVESYQQPPNGYSQLDNVPPPLQPLGEFAIDLFATREFKAAGITYRYELTDSIALKVDFTQGIDKRDNVGRYHYGAVGIDFIF